MPEVDVPEVGVSLSKVDVVVVGLSLAEVEAVDEGVSLSLSDIEETGIVEDWSFSEVKDDWSMKMRMGELVIDKVSIEVSESVEVESLSASSVSTGNQRGFFGALRYRSGRIDCKQCSNHIFCTKRMPQVSKQSAK